MAIATLRLINPSLTRKTFLIPVTLATVSSPLYIFAIPLLKKLSIDLFKAFSSFAYFLALAAMSIFVASSLNVACNSAVDIQSRLLLLVSGYFAASTVLALGAASALTVPLQYGSDF